MSHALQKEIAKVEKEKNQEQKLPVEGEVGESYRNNAGEIGMLKHYKVK